MNRILGTALGLGLTLAAVQASGDDQSAVKELIDRAIQAAGGEENLSRFKAFTYKLNGTVHEADGDVTFTSEWAIQGSGQSRAAFVWEEEGNKTREIRVLNGTKAWIKPAA